MCSFLFAQTVCWGVKITAMSVSFNKECQWNIEEGGGDDDGILCVGWRETMNSRKIFTWRKLGVLRKIIFVLIKFFDFKVY